MTRWTRAWKVGLAVWACGLLVYYGGPAALAWIRPSALDFRVVLHAADSQTITATATGSGRAVDALAEGCASGDGNSTVLQVHESEGGARATVDYLVEVSDRSAPRADALAWTRFRKLAGSELFPFDGELADATASAVFERPAGTTVLWLDDEVRWAPSDPALAWRVGTGDLRALRSGALLVAPACERVAGDEELVVLSDGGESRVTTLEVWRSELDRVLARPGSPRTLIVLDVPVDRPTTPTVQARGYALVPITGDGAAAREKLLEELCRSRLEAGGALPSELAWLDPAIARRVALALQPAEQEAARWRDLLAYRVFLACTYEAPLSAIDGLNDRAYDYVARLKGPQFLRAIEHAGVLDLDAESISRAWVDVRRAVAAGSSLRDEVVRAFGPGAGVEHDRSRGGELPLTRAPFERDLDLRPGPAHLAPTVSRLTIAATSDTENFLETCGCRLRQAGGIARRAHVLAKLREVAPLLAVDLGNLFPRIPFDEYDEITAGEVRVQLEADRAMETAFHVLGSNELYFGREALERAPRAFHAVNVRRADGGPTPWSHETPAVDVGGVRARLVGVCPTTPSWIDPDEWRRRTPDAVVEDPIAAIARACAGVPREQLLVVAGSVPTWRLAELVEAVPDIDVVLSSDARAASDATGPRDPENPFLFAPGFLGDTLVVFPNEESHGLEVVELEVAADGRVQQFRSRAQVLSPDIAEDPTVRALLDDFYAGLAPEARGPETWTPVAGLAAERELLAQQRHANGGEVEGYVGSAACRACHETAYANWERTPHAHAYRTLEEKHRARSADCLRCHVVGLGLPGGFSPADPRPPDGLRNVGCEVCHGPGHAHAVLRPGDPRAIRSGLDRAGCEACHDAEHSTSLEVRRVDPYDVGAHRGSQPASTGGVR